MKRLQIVASVCYPAPCSSLVFLPGKVDSIQPGTLNVRERNVVSGGDMATLEDGSE